MFIPKSEVSWVLLTNNNANIIYHQIEHLLIISGTLPLKIQCYCLDEELCVCVCIYIVVVIVFWTISGCTQDLFLLKGHYCFSDRAQGTILGIEPRLATFKENFLPLYYLSSPQKIVFFSSVCLFLLLRHTSGAQGLLPVSHFRVVWENHAILGIEIYFQYINICLSDRVLQGSDWVTSINSKGLLLTPCSGISSCSACGTICYMSKIKLGQVVYKASTVNPLLSLLIFTPPQRFLVNNLHTGSSDISYQFMKKNCYLTHGTLRL